MYAKPHQDLFALVIGFVLTATAAHPAWACTTKEDCDNSTFCDGAEQCTGGGGCGGNGGTVELITDRDNHRLAAGTVITTVGTTIGAMWSCNAEFEDCSLTLLPPVAGYENSAANTLNGPHNADRFASGSSFGPGSDPFAEVVTMWHLGFTRDDEHGYLESKTDLNNLVTGLLDGVVLANCIVTASSLHPTMADFMSCSSYVVPPPPRAAYRSPTRPSWLPSSRRPSPRPPPGAWWRWPCSSLRPARWSSPVGVVL